VNYMLLIYVDPEEAAAEGSEEARAQTERWAGYTESLAQAGVLREGAALQGPSTATVISQPNGQRVVTDGPFADTKEWLGGYYVIDVDDLDTALDFVSAMPNQAIGHTEVRPVREM
jgi:hypothetical protein